MYSAKRKYECAAREVRQRVKVYKSLVDQGRMTSTQAREEVAVMTEIAEDYRRQVRDLFGEPPQAKRYG